jgi:hypothetical protein
VGKGLKRRIAIANSHFFYCTRTARHTREARPSERASVFTYTFLDPILRPSGPPRARARLYGALPSSYRPRGATFLPSRIPLVLVWLCVCMCQWMCIIACVHHRVCDAQRHNDTAHQHPLTHAASLQPTDKNTASVRSSPRRPSMQLSRRPYPGAPPAHLPTRQRAAPQAQHAAAPRASPRRRARSRRRRGRQARARACRPRRAG